MDGGAFGTGLLRSLADSLSLGDGESRLGYAVMKAEIQKGMRDIIAKHAGQLKSGNFRVSRMKRLRNMQL